METVFWFNTCSPSQVQLFSYPGGGSGIGRAVCQRFASEGASVVVADISEESANETLGSLPSDFRGQGHMVGVVDVSSKESVKKLVTSIQVHGRYRETTTTLHFQRPLCSLDYAFKNTTLYLCSFKCPSVPVQSHYFQPPSVCLNAAGITQDDFLLNMEEDQFNRVIQVNLKVRRGSTQGSCSLQKVILWTWLLFSGATKLLIDRGTSTHNVEVT